LTVVYNNKSCVGKSCIFFEFCLVNLARDL
jgi:hypothetical protein